MIDYVARRLRYDTECILRALEDGEIELFHRDRLGDRSYNAYRLAAKGRRAYEGHIKEMIEWSRETTRRAKEELRIRAQCEPASAAEPEPSRPERRAHGAPA